MYVVEVSGKSKKRVKNLADVYTRYSNPLCKEHMPEGLPIDIPLVTVGSHHPARKFEQIVDAESKNMSLPKEVNESVVRLKLRETFARSYYSSENCVVCEHNSE